MTRIIQRSNVGGLQTFLGPASLHVPSADRGGGCRLRSFEEGAHMLEGQTQSFLWLAPQARSPLSSLSPCFALAPLHHPPRLLTLEGPSHLPSPAARPRTPPRTANTRRNPTAHSHH